MSVATGFIRGLLLASIGTVSLGASARGDVMLTLGVTDDGSLSPSPSATSSSYYAPTTATNSLGLIGLATSNASGTAASSSGSNLAGSFSSWTPAPAPAPTTTYYAPVVANASQTTYDAFINLGQGPYTSASGLSTSGAQAWYNSSAITGLFGGTPTPQQVANFDALVMQRVQSTFNLAGVPVSLTANPNLPASHSLSVVSNAVNPNNTQAIGMTNIGGSGFDFIDNAAAYAHSVDQLAWIVAHNVSHELMLAFGVPENYDQSGNDIDSTTGSLSMFLNPQATFSPAAAQALLSKDFLLGNGAGNSLGLQQAQLVGADTVPEPSTVLAWGLALAGAAAYARKRRANG